MSTAPAENFISRQFRCSGANMRHIIFTRFMGKHEALINIRTLEVIAGKLPRRALALTIEWAAEHRSQLIEDWDLCQARQQPKKIPPLE